MIIGISLVWAGQLPAPAVPLKLVCSGVPALRATPAFHRVLRKMMLVRVRLGLALMREVGACWGASASAQWQVFWGNVYWVRLLSAALRSKICQELCTCFHYVLLKITLQTNCEQAGRLYWHFSTLKTLLNFFWEGEQKCIVPHIDFPFFELSRYTEEMILSLSHPCMDFSHAVICTFWGA